MTTFHDRVFVALARFNGRLSAFTELVRSKPADAARVPRKALDELLGSAARAGGASEGSFKQRTFRRGNLQVCFASRPGDRIVVDADIDLYRAAVPHLFGEVLVNHLTGDPTDQYGVRKILDDQSVVPIGGFQLFTA